MNAPLPAVATASIPAFSMNEGELISALESSIYPGAKPESIKLVINVCRAQVLDPFQKPYHIVPMSVKKAGAKRDDSEKYEWRDVVMPGIGLYRIQAARTGCYAGVDEGVFGPMVTRRLGDNEVTFPEWCSVTVYRLVQGHRVPFSSGKVYWLESYATAGRNSLNPNAMWTKRGIGQLEKCAEALALRRAFPEIGAQPTAEEMEGKTLDEDGNVLVPASGPTPSQRPGPMSKSEAAKANAMDVDPATDEVTPPTHTASTPQGNGHTPADDKPSPPASEGMLRLIRAKAKQAGVEESAIVAKHGIDKLDAATVKIGNEILAGIAAGTYKAA